MFFSSTLMFFMFLANRMVVTSCGCLRHNSWRCNVFEAKDLGLCYVLTDISWSAYNIVLSVVVFL